MNQSKFEEWIAEANSLNPTQRELILAKLEPHHDIESSPSNGIEKPDESGPPPCESEKKASNWKFSCNSPFTFFVNEVDTLQSNPQRNKIKPRIPWYSRFVYIVIMSLLAGALLAVTIDS